MVNETALMFNDEVFFKTFDVERICFDKYFFLVWDEDYCKEDNPFDIQLRDRYHQNISKSRVKGRKWEDVLRSELDYSFWELRLKGARTMFVYVNLIRYIQAAKNIVVDSNLILKDNNFMPLNTTISLIDYINAKREVEQFAKKIYIEMVKNFWKVDLTKVKIKPVQLEICYEVFPGSVDDVVTRFHGKEIIFRKFNTQSQTLYLNDDIGGLEVRLPNGLSCRLYDGDIFNPFFQSSVSLGELSNNKGLVRSDCVYVNGGHAGYLDQKIQIKIYQKSYGLLRIEFTIVNKTIDYITDMDNPESDKRAVIEFVHRQLKVRLNMDEYLKRFDVTLDFIVDKIATATGIKPEQINLLREIEVFESTWETRNLVRRLLKKGLVERNTDDRGKYIRGSYPVASWLKALFKMFKPKGDELFLPGAIQPIKPFEKKEGDNINGNDDKRLSS